MSGIRAVGAGTPNLLRINGQEVVRPSGPAVPVEGTRPVAGALTQTPVEAKANPFALQEQMYDEAHAAELRGRLASEQLQGNKSTRRQRDIKSKKKEQTEHRRVEGPFSDDNPSSRQEQAYYVAAEFEEKVKDGDLSFKRKAAQVQVGERVFRADLDGDKGALLSGETDLHYLPQSDEVDALTQPMIRRGGSELNYQTLETSRSETVPNAVLPNTTVSETGLRRILGLGKKK